MTEKTQSRQQEALRALPSVDALLRTETALALRETVGAQHLVTLARIVTEEMRAAIQANHSSTEQDGPQPDQTREALLAEAASRLERAGRLETNSGLRRVINASGVILHTNLGRAPLSDAARGQIASEAAGYCTLEYDARTGSRGRRGARVEQFLIDLTGAEAALVVNNCAAAALLVLTVLGAGGEAIVSRGELVEIGGDFRVPDVMAQTGTRLVEVGTTNRTRLVDYERAITDETRLLVRVHTSNYRIVGFTSQPPLAELAELAHRAGLPFYEDAGSGALFDLRPYGLEGEPVIGESIRDGADVVSFSGDKLLGASQAGLVVGRRPLIEKLRKHPLYRALRVDKLSLAALEATLAAHARGVSFKEVPVLRMLALTREEIEARARTLLYSLAERGPAASLHYEIIEGESAIGGGAAPLAHPRTALIALTHDNLTAAALEEILRALQPPIIARIVDGRVLLDLRTVMEDEEATLLDALVSLPA
jgi:L-seryl-tRNA(Ser) seleniumtransferase